MKKSLGLVEVRGMTAAITVADTMCKTANVTIHKLEKTRGGGWMVAMIVGDVQGVQVAVEAGAVVAKGMNCYIGQTVIARLSDGIMDMFPQNVQSAIKEVIVDDASLDVNQENNDITEDISLIDEEIIEVDIDTVDTKEDISADSIVVEDLSENNDFVELESVESPVETTVEEENSVENISVEFSEGEPIQKPEKRRMKKSKRTKRK